MIKIITSFIVLTGILFAQKNIELTGEFANNNGNPFKRVLKTKKLGIINYTNIDKDLVLSVETNLETDSLMSLIRPQDKYRISSTDLNKIFKTYLTEDYNINPNGKDFNINFNKGLVEVEYTEPDSNNNINAISKIEVTLNYTLTKNGAITKDSIKLDHTLGITGDNYDWAITTEKDFFWRGLETNIQRIIETAIFKIINKG